MDERGGLLGGSGVGYYIAMVDLPPLIETTPFRSPPHPLRARPTRAILYRTSAIRFCGVGGVHSVTSVTLDLDCRGRRAASLPVVTSPTYTAASTTFRPPVTGMDTRLKLPLQPPYELVRVDDVRLA